MKRKRIRFLNWPHAIVGFLIGIALVLYLRGEPSEDSSVGTSQEVAEVQTR